LLDGLKRPGLDEGVLAAVFVAAAESIVEVQQGKSRHFLGGGPTPGKSGRGQQAADMIEMEAMAMGCGRYVAVVVPNAAALGRK